MLLLNFASRLTFLVITGFCVCSSRAGSKPCSENSTCASTEACLDGFCADPCNVTYCGGANTQCIVNHHSVKCVCKPKFVQDEKGCKLPAGSKPCSENSSCASTEACLEGVCDDPCKVADCGGPNTMCKVNHHSPKCSCKPGFVLGEKGCKLPAGSKPCSENSTCASAEACLKGVCDDPCKVADCGGPNTMCEVNHHSPKCSCKPGFVLGKNGCKLPDTPSISTPKPFGWVKWVPGKKGVIPANAVLGGFDNENLYVGRATQDGALIPCKIIPWQGICYMAYDGREHNISSYEALTGGNLLWVQSKEGHVLPDAVTGGYTKDGETLYIGRIEYLNTIMMGKVQPSLGKLYIGYKGKEVSFKQYEVLVMQ